MANSTAFKHNFFLFTRKLYRSPLISHGRIFHIHTGGLWFWKAPLYDVKKKTKHGGKEGKSPNLAD